METGKRGLEVYRSSSEVCQNGEDTLVQEAHEHIKLLLIRLDEQQRRWYAAILAKTIGLKRE